ncbi:RNA polymerase sigma factor [Shouchella clausii]|uniref:RNA polymerase sigma factor n=1 Tax=Shouchella clausii TaxID=79880 RepID=UPI002DBA3C17|nr:RNA polymerase sigma factor [Shouchella clausii]MEB5482252.1 RNA polymerase sigma factor [Shouchella clausii]
MEERWWLLFESEFDALSYDLQRYLYDSFFRFAYKEIIYLLEDHALAEDIIQEAFLKATAKRHQLKNVASGKQWVRRIVRNQMLDSIKSKKNRHWTNLEDVYKVNVKDSSPLEVAASIENNVEDVLRNQMLHEAIMELKEEYRTLLIKYYMEEKPYKEIALELGISEQVIAQRLFRARKKLLSQFSRKWVDKDGE